MIKTDKKKKKKSLIASFYCRQLGGMQQTVSLEVAKWLGEQAFLQSLPAAFSNDMEYLDKLKKVVFQWSFIWKKSSVSGTIS